MRVLVGSDVIIVVRSQLATQNADHGVIVIVAQTMAYVQSTSARCFLRTVDRDTVLLFTNIELLSLIYKLAMVDWNGGSRAHWSFVGSFRSKVLHKTVGGKGNEIALAITLHRSTPM
jgi:hypothetical protein